MLPPLLALVFSPLFSGLKAYPCGGIAFSSSQPVTTLSPGSNPFAILFLYLLTFKGPPPWSLKKPSIIWAHPFVLLSVRLMTPDLMNLFFSTWYPTMIKVGLRNVMHLRFREFWWFPLLILGGYSWHELSQLHPPDCKPHDRQVPILYILFRSPRKDLFSQLLYLPATTNSPRICIGNRSTSIFSFSSSSLISFRSNAFRFTIRVRISPLPAPSHQTIFPTLTKVVSFVLPWHSLLFFSWFRIHCYL